MLFTFKQIKQIKNNSRYYFMHALIFSIVVELFGQKVKRSEPKSKMLFWADQLCYVVFASLFLLYPQLYSSQNE